MAPIKGAVTAAVARVLDDHIFGDSVNDALASLALALAGLVDGGSVPAAAQLRVLLDGLVGRQSAEDVEFLASIRTPGLSTAGVNGRA